MNRTYPQNDGRRPPQPSLSSSTLLVPFLTQSPSPALSNSVLRWSRDQMFFRNCRFSREATAAGCFSEAYLRAFFFCSNTCDVEPTQRYAIVFLLFPNPSPVYVSHLDRPPPGLVHCPMDEGTAGGEERCRRRRRDSLVLAMRGPRTPKSRSLREGVVVSDAREGFSKSPSQVGLSAGRRKMTQKSYAPTTCHLPEFWVLR